MRQFLGCDKRLAVSPEREGSLCKSCRAAGHAHRASDGNVVPKKPSLFSRARTTPTQTIQRERASDRASERERERARGPIRAAPVRYTLLLPTDDTTTVTRLTRVSDTKTMCMHTQSTTPPSKLLYTKKKQTTVYKRAALFYTPPSTFCTQRVPLLYTKELHNDTR